MLKIMLVDDEPLIRDGLTNFPWKNYGFEFAGAAEDGSEALIMAKTVRPDLIISDIKMPGMSGLELTSMLKERYPDITIILLTGHNETELVQSALKLHVDNYLLKPVNFDELQEILRKTALAITARRNRQEQFKKMDKQLSAALPMLKTNLLSELISGRFHNEEEILKWFELFDITTGQHLFIATAFQLKEGFDPENVRENWLISVAVSNICSEIFSNFTQEVLYYFEHPHLYFLLIFPDSLSDTDCYDATLHATKKIQNSVQTLLDAQISFGISLTSQALLGIHTLYKQCQAAYSHSLFFGKNMTILYRDIEKNTETLYSFPQGMQELMNYAVRTGADKEVQRILNDLKLNLSNYPTLNIGYVKNTLISILLNSLQVLGEKQPTEHDSFDWIYQLLKCNTQEELFSYSEKLLLSSMEHEQRNSITQYHAIASEIIKYIQEHFNSDLSLDHLADQFHFSPSYISRLIRKSSGINFSEILTETRMLHAKKLLKEGKLKTSEISECSGYKDSSYFIQIFKKRYGITPSEYKSMMKLSISKGNS